MIPNGSDIPLFAKPSKTWYPVGVLSTDFMAIYTGTHGMANGLDAVLNAAVILKARNRRDIKLVLVGDGKLKPALQLKAQRLELENVVFHTPVDKQKLSELMASAHVGIQSLENVSAFYFGTSPNKFFDYLAAGLPVLINYPGWLAETITQAGCGYVVKPDCPEAFANALERAASDPEELRVMGRRGYELARSKFSRDLLSRQFIDWIIGTRV